MPIQLIFFDDDFREQLLPLSATRPLAEFRNGIFTIREKWERRLNAGSTYQLDNYLQVLYPFEPKNGADFIRINGRVVPSAALADEVRALQPGEVLLKGDSLIACNTGTSATSLKLHESDHFKTSFAFKQSTAECILIQRIHDLFLHNSRALLWDMELVLNEQSEKLSNTNRVIGDHPVWLGKGARAEACIFNTSAGPIYIGEGAEIMEGALIRGPIAICTGAQVKMGAKLYADSTIGPGCKVGGEITNSVFFANSNKAHDGYLGNSVIGEWCNLGADTNCSNLKNNYGSVSVHNYAIGGSEDSGLQFQGVILGDHTKCGINTMFNTGSVAGVGVNVFGGNFPPKFIPDFSWGGSDGFTVYNFEKAVESVKKVYQRRNKTLSQAEYAVLQHIFKQTVSLRQF
jgi:UDP-N-acetylglucosamine diphosphorylase/glucosamine-1-phosphate N-acetyltransferase